MVAELVKMDIKLENRQNSTYSVWYGCSSGGDYALHAYVASNYDLYVRTDDATIDGGSMNVTFAPSANAAEAAPLETNTREIKTLAEGSITGTQWTDTFLLHNANGEYVNFWVSNKGTNNVLMSINGKNEREVTPGESGYIYLDVSALGANYKCKAGPSSSGKISVDYRVAQSDSHLDNDDSAYLIDAQEASPDAPQRGTQIYQKTIRVSDGTFRDEFYNHGTNGFRWSCENNGTASFTLEVRLPNGDRVAMINLHPGNTFYSDYDSGMPQGLYDFSINNTDGSDLDCLFRVNLLQ